MGKINLRSRSPMNDNLELNGRRALVTGASKGIGEAVAARLREAGATILTTARTRSDSAEDLFVASDITTAEGCAAVADAVRDRLGGVDIIDHPCAGPTRGLNRCPELASLLDRYRIAIV